MGKLRAALLTLVRRPGAEEHLLLSLLAFALSVTLTRLLLWLTRYPTFGGEIFHISHVLWGGLFLFAAALLPLIFANQRIYRLTAILSGLGMGLFIDEVGKFITHSYDYFFPFAAPIIYAFFLVCVLVYLQVSKPRIRSARIELYAALEYLEQVLERDLDPHERRLLTEHLESAASQDEEPELAHLANLLLGFVNGDAILEVPPSQGWLDNLHTRFQSWQSQLYARPAALPGMVAVLGMLGISSLSASTWLVINNIRILEFEAGFFTRLNTNTGYSWWIFTLAFLLGITGLGLLLGAGWIWLGRKRAWPDSALPPVNNSRYSKGLRWSFTSLVLQLTVLDLLLFYYIQFGTAVLVLIQFTLLLAVIHYQRAA